MNKFICFVLGSVLGAAGGYYLAKAKYEERLNNEIQALRAVDEEKTQEVEERPVRVCEDSTDKKVFTNLTEQYKTSDKEDKTNYSGYFGAKEADPKILPDSDAEGVNVPDPDTDQPFVIPPDSFGDEEDNDVVELTLYSDGVLTGMDDRAMSSEDIQNYVGLDSLTHFGEYEDDSVFVRNNRLKADFQIIRVDETYESVLAEKPYLKED